MTSKYDDVRITQEIDDDGRRFVLSLDGKRIVANSMKECLKAMGLIHHLPDNCRGKTLDVNTARLRARRHRRKERIASRVVQPLSTDDSRLHHCRFQELAVEPQSVHLILTDIPYGEAFLPELRDLADFAARVLAEGGLFVTYCGQFHLDTVMRALSEHLTYRWTLASVWSGEGTVVQPRHVISKWKPIFVFSCGRWASRGLWPDVVRVDSREKQFHDWQQPIDEAERLVSYFSTPGDLVCDPCAGSFTTAVACALHNRRFVGCDCEQENIVVGQQRVAQILATS